MAVLIRLLVVAVLLSSAVTLSARGRARGYQAGGGVHHGQPKLPPKQHKDKQKKPSPPPESKPAT